MTSHKTGWIPGHGHGGLESRVERCQVHASLDPRRGLAEDVIASVNRKQYKTHIGALNILPGSTKLKQLTLFEAPFRLREGCVRGVCRPLLLLLVFTLQERSAIREEILLLKYEASDSRLCLSPTTLHALGTSSECFTTIKSSFRGEPVGNDVNGSICMAQCHIYCY